MEHWARLNNEAVYLELDVNCVFEIHATYRSIYELSLL